MLLIRHQHHFPSIQSSVKRHRSPILNPLLPELSLKRNSTMKFHLCLLPILPVIIANPTGPITQPAHIERVEMPNAAEEQYRLARATVEDYAIEFHHELGSHLRKRGSPTCFTDCGKPSINDCNKLFEIFNSAASDVPICPRNFVTTFTVNDCIFTFAGHGDKSNTTICVSTGRLNALSKEIFDHCVNNPMFGLGGCYDLEDSGRVCVRNSDAGECF